MEQLKMDRSMDQLKMDQDRMMDRSMDQMDQMDQLKLERRHLQV
jgi:hypothetical protein